MMALRSVVGTRRERVPNTERTGGGAERGTGARAARRRLALAFTAALVLLAVSVASAQACPVLAATSHWTGHWRSNGGYQGTWEVDVTTTKRGGGNYTFTGAGKVVFVGFGGTYEYPGNETGTATCSGGTTDAIASTWEDSRPGTDKLVGTLALNDTGAIETGTWEGSGVFGFETGTWQGEFIATVQSGGYVEGEVEVEASSGTLVHSVEIEDASKLPTLEPGFVAPIGGLSFDVSIPSGKTSVHITLTLPAGSNPTNLLKLVGGIYQEVTPVTIIGDVIEFDLVDNGPFDENPATGEIKDPVVPVSEPPIVSAVAPGKGYVAGGTAVTVTGLNFTEGATVEFGSTPAAEVTVNGPTSITAVSPAHLPGMVDVSVTSPNGASPPAKHDRFKFTPTISSVSPNSGGTAGGETVTITGTGFLSGLTTVKFGMAIATVTECTSWNPLEPAVETACTVITPPHAAGKVGVKVTVNKASSAGGVASKFTYS